MIGRVYIPNTDIEVSRLGFGTASLHHNYSSRKRQSLLYKASEVGITHFDTAPYYGFGLAEYDLGRFLKSRRSKFTVTTKVGLYPRGEGHRNASSIWFRKGLSIFSSSFSLPEVNQRIERAARSLRESLKRLETDYIDFLFLHEPDIHIINTDEMLGWMQKELLRGHIRSWGVSGIRESVLPFVLPNHPIANVTQTLDSIFFKQADFILDAGRSLQFTYGYLSQALKTTRIFTPAQILSEAIHRNTTGSILISARKERHIKELSISLK
jgi:D-threo-aldose 1-dehydrogenase